MSFEYPVSHRWFQKVIPDSSDDVDGARASELIISQRIHRHMNTLHFLP